MENRKFKFRVWNGEQMISPDYITRDGVAHWKENSIPQSSEKLMQFTGLKDINGVGIYEGDIVKTDANHFCHVQSDWCEYTAGQVYWMRFGFYVCQKYRGANEIVYYTCAGDEESGLEIIGNIYANPELLEQETKSNSAA